MATGPKAQKFSKHWKSHAVNQKDVAAKWKKDGFSCDLWIDPPGKTWVDYVHDTDERICVVEGELELEMNGSRTELYATEEAFIPARTTHSVRNIGKGETKWLYGYKKKQQVT
jgi:mannose-6-phosphate isomerase-like protein (cupin superfamily)